jgi:ATP-dependent Lon protease
MVDNDTNERGNTTTAATQTLGVLELPGVILPGTVVTLTLDDDDTRAIANAAAGGRVLLLPQGTESPVGVVARVPDVGALPNGTPAAIVQAEHRARVISIRDSERAGRQAEVVEVLDPRPSPRVEALGRELRVVLEEIANLRRSRRLPEVLRTVTAPGALADAATSWADGNLEHKLTVLAAVDVAGRVEVVLKWAKDMLAELQVSEQIRSDVTEGMDKRQREFLLREQMAAIRKELGEGDDDIVAEYRTKVAELGEHLPAKARQAIDKELDRLERVGGQSPEQSWIRTWLDRVLELPWADRTTDNLDLTAARDVLDADHYGLGDVKDRIVEYLAVRKLRRDKGLDTASTDDQATSRRGLGAIVTLVGPPGVGKTSLGESVARAMGRNFVRVALGGVRDEAEIRGHRRTYVGSQPGRIARAISEAGSMNPVVLLDEVDKLSAGGWSGDPTAALLEVLDPAQNHTFRDHYLEIDLDLSDVVFIATANTLETVPGPLLDRMEIVRLDGYTAEEKSFIARRFLLPRQLKLAGLDDGDVVIDDAMVESIINGYTREAGVRSLERELGKLTRKVAAKVATGSVQPPVTIEELQPWLGRQKVDDEIPERTSVPGVATGLAVTGAGGDVLFVEVTASPSTTTELTLTGQLGDVMKESAQIALSYIASHAADLGVDDEALKQHFHVHVPAGAVPKDGPSAGVTMTTALLSLLTGNPVKPTVGMTGEITLQGLVLPIGGVKQKVLAAHRAGLTEVVLPKRNGPDLDDVPEKVRDAMIFHLAATYADVQKAALS